MKHITVLLFLFTILFSCSENPLPKTKNESSESVQNVKIPGYDRDSDEWKEVESNLNLHLNALNRGDFDIHLDYISPRLFQINSREEIKNAMVSYQERGISTGISDMNLTYLSPIHENDSGRYALLAFDGVMSVKFDERFQGDPQAFLPTLQAEHGEEYVLYNSDSSKFSIEKNFFMYTMAHPGTKDWKFIDYGFNAMSGSEKIMSFEMLRLLKGHESEYLKSKR